MTSTDNIQNGHSLSDDPESVTRSSQPDDANDEAIADADKSSLVRPQAEELTDLPEAPLAPASKQKWRIRHWPRWVKWSAALVASLIVVATIAIGAVLWRLSDGTSISSEALASHIRRNAETHLPEDLTLDFDGSGVSLDPLRGLVAGVTELRLTSATGQLELWSRQVSVGLDFWSLLMGQMRIRDIEFDTLEVLLQLTGASERTISQFNFSDPGFSDQTAANSTAGVPVVAETPMLQVGRNLDTLHQAVDGMLELAAQRGLERITILDGTASLLTGLRGRERRYEQIRADVNIDTAENALSVNAVGVAADGAWRIKGSAMPVENDLGHEINIDLQDVSLAEFLPNLGRDDFAIRTNALVSVKMRSRYVPEHTVPKASFDMEVSGAYVFIGERDVALLDGGKLSLIWAPELNALSIEDASLQFGPTRLPFIGYIRPSERNPLSELDFRLVAREAVLAPRDNVSGPVVRPELIGIDGRYELGSRYLSLDGFEMQLGSTAMIGSGSVSFQTRFPSIAAAFTSGPVDAQVFKQIWPPTIMAGPRRWFINSVKDGVIEQANLTLAVPPGLIGNRDPEKVFPKGAFRGEVAFRDAKLRTFGDLPDLEAPQGRLQLGEDGLTVFIENGDVDSPAGETVRVPSAVFRMPVLGPRNPNAQVSVSMIGDGAALASIADADPLNFMTARGVPPDAVQGQAVAEVQSAFQLRSAIDPAGVETVATIRLTDFASDVPIQGRSISDGDVVVEVKAEGTTVRGRAELDGLPADVDLFLPSGQSGIGSRTNVQLTLSDSQRRSIGIDLGEMLRGPTPVAIGDADDAGRRPVNVDLTQTRLSLAPIGWSKGVGVPAQMSFLLAETENGQRLDDIRLTGEGFSAAGEASISNARGLERLTLSQVSLRRGDSATLQLRRTGRDLYNITIRGEQIDGRGIVRAIKSAGGDSDDADGGPSIVLDAQIDTLIGFNNQTIADAKMTLQSDGGFPSALTFGGIHGGGGAVNASIEGGNGSSWLSVNSVNGGAAIGFLDFSGGITGGQLSVSANLAQGGGATVGQALLNNFQVGESRSLDQLSRSVARNTAQAAQARTFERARMEFTLRGDQIIIDDASLRGPALGVTLNGAVNTQSSQLRLNGVFVPAYGLNNAFSRIPILGPIMGGDRDQGLLGVTFRVSGPVSEPLLTVNPISAIAPGVFRRIFEFR